MRNKAEKKTHIIAAWLTEADYSTMLTIYQSTTCRQMADYIRKSVTHKPITFLQRDQSLDDFLADMIALRRELHQISDHFSIAVQKLGTLSNTTEMLHWIMLNERDKTHLFRQIEAINNRVNQIYQLCSQK